MEVGARLYRSRSLLCCLRNLGFNNTLVKQTFCEQIIVGIFFLYLAGQRQYRLAIC